MPGASTGYDPLTFRLTDLSTVRGRRRLQDLRYTYDPVGNPTLVHDHAQQRIFFRNRVAEPSARYTYDAAYRLIEATGREHLGQATDGSARATAPTAADGPRTGLPQPGDGLAMARYAERYRYDPAGNLLQVAHRSADQAQADWTREYRYGEPSLLEPGRHGDRLTSVGSAGDHHEGTGFGYDEQGNLIAMPQLPALRWDPDDRLQATSHHKPAEGLLPGQTCYVYDGAGLRVRKVTERPGQPHVRASERIYLGAFEVHREYAADGAVATEYETVHLIDDRQRVALVETRTAGRDAGPGRLIRYQLADRLDSCVLELDERARVITYEEYYPYGATSYQAVRSRTEAPKRYRFTGKERDTETGLYYHGARYYMPWLARWTSCDPAGLVNGTNLYSYVRGNPVRLRDPAGTDGDDQDQGDPPPGTSERGRDRLPDVSVPRLSIDAANFLFSSVIQGLGIMSTGSVDVEAGAVGMYSWTSGKLTPPQTGGGLANAAVAARQQITALPGFDLGGAVTGSFTGLSGGGTSQQGGNVTAAGTAHYGSKFGEDTSWGGAGYLLAGAQYAGQSGSPSAWAGVLQFTPAIGLEHDAPDDPANPYKAYFSTAMLNLPTISYASRGSLSQGPPLTDIVSVGGTAAVGWGFGKPVSLLFEGALGYASGSPDRAAGFDQAASSWTGRAGLILTVNWIDRTTSGPQTSSAAFGVWFSHERGNVTGTPRPDAPIGNYDTNSVMFGVILGYRRNPGQD